MASYKFPLGFSVVFAPFLTSNANFPSGVVWLMDSTSSPNPFLLKSTRAYASPAIYDTEQLIQQNTTTALWISIHIIHFI
jgi:hypothetical protein